jgi:hypothetical protein
MSIYGTTPGPVGGSGPQDDAYRQLYGARNGQVNTLRQSMGALGVALQMPSSSPPPPTWQMPAAPMPPFPPPPNVPGQPPPGALMPPPGGGAPPGGPPPGAGGAPGGGGGGGGGGGDKKDKEKPKIPLRKWRLRAIPMLARNIACIGIGTNFWMGVIILTSPQYSARAATTTTSRYRPAHPHTAHRTLHTAHGTLHTA